ncbi:MAG TPA: hypothetical protein VMU61_11345 [Candidatus Aquilonibacter sp.]|nr:hypothetical protein [Candidatus Aquilonibacter sp.]
MHLMRAIEVEATPRDRVFRMSRVNAIVFVLACVGACAAMIVYRWPAPKPAYYISAVIFVFLLFLRRFVTERFRTSNWLVRTSDAGIYLHFRSYLNDRMAEEDPTVVFLPYGEIRSARKVRETTTTPDLNRRTTTQILHWVELELAVEPTPLAAALSDESARPGATEKHWYGSSTTLYQDYPVQMETPPFLRVRWQVVPGARVFLAALKERNVEIAPAVAVSEDFAHLRGLTPEEQAKRLRELDRRGDTIGAVYGARRLYGYDLTQATRFVEGLRGGV